MTRPWPNQVRTPTSPFLGARVWGPLVRKRATRFVKAASRSLVSPKLSGHACPQQIHQPMPPTGSGQDRAGQGRTGQDSWCRRWWVWRSLRTNWRAGSGQVTEVTSPQGPLLPPSFSSHHHLPPSPSPRRPKRPTLNPPPFPTSRHKQLLDFFSPLRLCLTSRLDDLGFAFRTNPSFDILCFLS